MHFEIIGTDPARLRAYYGELFGWEYDTASVVSPRVSDEGEYGFTEPGPIPGGIGGGPGFASHTVFYVGVPDVGAALAEAERLGGTRRMGPDRVEATGLVVAHFTDPEGNLVGLAGPA